MKATVATEAIELSNHHRALRLARPGKRRGKFRAAIERIGTLSRLDLDVLGDDLDPLGFGEPRDSGFLRLDPEPAAALLLP
jgi:hypothetical protein